MHVFYTLAFKKEPNNIITVYKSAFEASGYPASSEGLPGSFSDEIFASATKDGVTFHYYGLNDSREQNTEEELFKYLLEILKSLDVNQLLETLKYNHGVALSDPYQHDEASVSINVDVFAEHKYKQESVGDQDALMTIAFKTGQDIFKHFSKSMEIFSVEDRNKAWDAIIKHPGHLRLTLLQDDYFVDILCLSEEKLTTEHRRDIWASINLSSSIKSDMSGLITNYDTLYRLMRLSIKQLPEEFREAVFMNCGVEISEINQISNRHQEMLACQLPAKVRKELLVRGSSEQTTLSSYQKSPAEKTSGYNRFFVAPLSSKGIPPTECDTPLKKQ